MRDWTAVGIILLMLTAGLAGCIGPEGTAGPTSTAGDDATEPSWARDIEEASGRDARDLIESFVMTHPFRSQNPAYASFMQAARDDLAVYLEAQDLEVVRHDYGEGVNILGIQKGTQNPDRWVVLSAHYDTIAAGAGTTVYGAWDNGAGLAALMELAQAMSAGDLPFTVVYAFFDGEEKGLQGSAAFVEDYITTGKADVLANINTDPPGLNWPCGDEGGPFPVTIVHEEDKVEDPSLPRYERLHGAIEHGLDAAEVPDEHRDYAPRIPIATVGPNGLWGTSDHASFGAVNVANVFIGGMPTTRGPAGSAVLTYPLHTPLDTLQALEARCQTGSLAGGLDTVVETISHAVLELARTHPTGSQRS